MDILLTFNYFFTYLNRSETIYAIRLPLKWKSQLLLCILRNQFSLVLDTISLYKVSVATTESFEIDTGVIGVIHFPDEVRTRLSKELRSD